MVELLHPDDWSEQEATIQPFDEELSIVHELVHLWFTPINYDPYDGAERLAEEQAVHRISQALVALKRGREGEPSHQ